ncbi:hypothetical protein DLAC_04644 [Tieghemostelium lacteum]|uniref:Senescence domain-containing protein n=1 Tax=Tieghemostelium lacteum TaxID=361077 RepID=A0A151ZK25_TIELA|nr:hypothetical protein DLAC_04644 [Tieghemostelium lacteum]|eukprot:KYQ94348.1 hypothetical protein DLAC_04644 [Tieghemostelium lacteum]
MDTSQDYSIAISKLLSECLKLQYDSDNLVEDIIKNRDSIKLEEISKTFDTAISTFQRTIDIMNNIFKVETANQLTNEYKSYLESTINRKNELIQLKAKTMAEKVQYIQDHDSDIISFSETLMTLSDCVVYKWQEDQSEENIEKEIIGNGSIYLQKMYDNLHCLMVKLEQQSSSTQNKVHFYLIKETPILISNKGHYIIQIQNEFYGLLFPPKMPTIYLDLFEKQLCQVSTFVYLPNSSTPITSETSIENNTTLTSTTTTTSTTIETLKTEIPTFTIKSLKTLTSGVESGSASISNVILTTSAMVSVGLRGGGMYLQSNLERHQEEVVVSPFVSKSIGFVKTVTPYAVSSSGFVIDSLAGLFSGVGSTVINTVKLFIPEESEKEKSEVLEAAGDFGKTSFKAIGTIFDALSDGFSQIYQEASGTTVDIMHHKFGKQVATITGDSFSIGKDVVDTTLTLGSAKGIAMKVAKNGTVKIVEDNFIDKIQQDQTLLIDNVNKDVQE